ncbi:hypothetical protein OXIME_000164 [Oxyplasma meridianum]|uniref:Uncharacterized protein n=1 Tax=Oxyplasma meridianum TaxID=3073602 RepID=A0AAX4NEJ2_9ARCH
MDNENIPLGTTSWKRVRVSGGWKISAYIIHGWQLRLAGEGQI